MLHLPGGVTDWQSCYLYYVELVALELRSVSYFGSLDGWQSRLVVLILASDDSLTDPEVRF